MQNLDFSNRIHTRPVVAEEVEAIPEKSMKRSFSGITLFISIAAITYSLGIITGIQLNQFSKIEDGIVKYPDGKKSSVKERESTQSFSNISEDSKSISVDGTFLIKVGTFTESDAEKLTESLNQKHDLNRIKPVPCRGVKESVPERGIAFRTQAKSSGQNIFLGCFSELKQAENAANLLKSLKIPGTGGARIFELE